MGSSFVSILTNRNKTNVMSIDRFANKEFQGKGSCQIQQNLNDKKIYRQLGTVSSAKEVEGGGSTIGGDRSSLSRRKRDRAFRRS